MSNKYLVYMYTNIINNKKYIGATTNIKKRSGVNGEYYRGSPKFYNAILKYGWENFKVKILQDKLSKKEASEVEKKFIKEFNTTQEDYGYNLQRGGFPKAFESYSKERNERISETLHKQRSSEEYRKIMSDRMRKVWQEKRDEILNKRKDKTKGGRKPIRLFCKNLNKVFSSCAEAARELDVSSTCIYHALKRKQRFITKNRFKHDSVTYEIEVL